MPFEPPWKTGGITKISTLVDKYDDWDHATAIAVALAESRGIVSVVSPPNTDGTRDRGLFQINDVHTEYDHKLLVESAEYNTQAAHNIWKQAGGSFSPWTTYKTGAYKIFMGHDGIAIGGKSHVVGTEEAKAVAGAAKDTANAATGGLQAIADVVTALTKASTYQRLGKGALGGVLIILGVGGVVFVITKNVPAPVKAAAKMAAL